MIPAQPTMNPKPSRRRLLRLQRECDVSALPTLLLLAGAATLALALALNAVLDVRAPAQAGESTLQTLPPAA